MEGILDPLKLSYTDNQNATPQAVWGVVFIHGFPFDRTMWKAQVAALELHYRVVAYDHRGHGKSASRSPYLFEAFVDDLWGLLDHLKLQKAVLCGLSMGGYVALRAMERNPERVAGLILCDTKSEADTDVARLSRAKDLSAIDKDGLPAFATAFAQRALAPSTLQNRPEMVRTVEKMIAGNPAEGVKAALVALATRTDTTASLAKINVPTLIVVGEHDAITPPDNARALQSRIAGSKITMIPNAGHLSNLENETAFQDALLPFLSTLTK